ncbi:unnamed protein product [Lathyrus oleraceus]
MQGLSVCYTELFCLLMIGLCLACLNDVVMIAGLCVALQVCWIDCHVNMQCQCVARQTAYLCLLVMLYYMPGLTLFPLVAYDRVVSMNAHHEIGSICRVLMPCILATLTYLNARVCTIVTDSMI